jgi:hypothetical protein
MCTVGYVSDLSILFKNRDKNVATEEEIVQESGFVAVRTKGANYYSLGVNVHGFAFVSTAINTRKWTALAAVGNRAGAAQQYAIENDSLASPTKLISQHLAELKSAREAVDLLAASDLNFMGYNLVAIDRSEAYRVECYRHQRHAHKLPERAIVTNHFDHIQHGPKKFKDYPSSFKRETEAKRRIELSNNTADLWALMKFTSVDDEDQSIWRIGENFWTVSSTILNVDKDSLILSTTPTLDGTSMSVVAAVQ